MTRSKFSTKAILLAGGIGLSIATSAGAQPAAAQSDCPTGTVYGCTTGDVGYYGYYYGNPYGAYGTVRRWGVPVYDHGSVHGFGHSMGRAVGVDRGFSAAHFGGGGFANGFADRGVNVAHLGGGGFAHGMGRGFDGGGGEHR